ncbi:hypothetical protein VX037_15305, partial [Gordonia sp. Z-3]|uniref:hypothetical protein n=1 Tax=Gordonia sp. Z-3 TaxID=3115408 RepID=UPI002E2C06C3
DGAGPALTPVLLAALVDPRSATRTLDGAGPALTPVLLAALVDPRSATRTLEHVREHHRSSPSAG